MVKSTSKHMSGKPEKPRSEFPLFPHRNGQWAKKIRGRMHYFGLWADPAAALKQYLDQKDDLHAGRRPKQSADELTLRDGVNRFLTAKKLLVDSGEITARTWADYHATCARILKAIGKTRLLDDIGADDFSRYRAALAKKWGPVSVGNEIQRVRVLFKWAYDSELLKQPMRYGPGFKRPTKVLRKERAKKGPRMFEAEEIRRLLGLPPWRSAAGSPLSAMILLGVNCGFGNNDVGLLPRSAVNLDTGWVDYPRPKTGVARRCRLWPETINAIREALEARPRPKSVEDDRLLFLTQRGARWAKGTTDNPVSKEIAKLLRMLQMNRPGLNFYSLRHTFETIGGASKDQVAVDHIMGHSRDDMASVYRERIDDVRLQAVTNHIRQWLFGKRDDRDSINLKGRPTLRLVSPDHIEDPIRTQTAAVAEQTSGG